MSLIDDLLGRYVPSSETFDVPLPTGEVMTFKRAQSYGDLASFKNAAAEFIQLCEKGYPGIGKVERVEAAAAFTIHWYSAEPTRLEQLDALKLLKAPVLVEYLVSQIDANQTDRLNAAFEKAVDDEGNASRETEPSA